MFNSIIKKKQKKIREKIAKQKKNRLTVYKSNKHTYAQLYNSDGTQIITSASTIDKSFKIEALNKKLNKTEQASLVGNIIAKKIINNNIDKTIVFDRSGFKFHGRIKSIANSIKTHGIKC